MDVQFKNGCAFVHGVLERPIKIPSAMYPLNGESLMLTHENTSSFDDSPESGIIRRVFNSVPAEIGRCYTNASNLQKALLQEGIAAKTLVGWMFVFNAPPVHHCMVCVNDHVLDFNIRPELLVGDALNTLSYSQRRTAMADKMVQLLKNPFSDVATFGSLSKHAIFFGSFCSPEKGRETYQKLVRAYPKHPMIGETDAGGATPIQRMVLSHKQ